MSTATDVPGLLVRVREAKESARRMYDPNGPDPVAGKFWFEIDITAITQDIYVPISISSGKKPTGFSYEIEGNAPSSLRTTDISCQGDGITQITLGTLAYCKIPTGLTATFRIRIEVRGKLGKRYSIVIYQILYKFHPTDVRYQKSVQDIQSRMVKFV